MPPFNSWFYTKKQPKKFYLSMWMMYIHIWIKEYQCIEKCAPKCLNVCTYKDTGMCSTCRCAQHEGLRMMTSYKLPNLARSIICGWTTSAHFGVELPWNRTLSPIKTYIKYKCWVHEQPVLKYPRDWSTLRLKIPVFFRFISPFVLKLLRYGTARAFWTLVWALEYSYNHITINLEV